MSSAHGGNPPSGDYRYRRNAAIAKKSKSADKPGSVTALARYGRHSSRRSVAAALVPPTRGLGEQRHRPPTWCCSGWRLPRFTRRRLTVGDSSLWPCSSPSSAALTATYSVRALPGILLCGARTFLPPYRFHGQGGDGLAGFGPLVYCDLRWAWASYGRSRAVHLPRHGDRRRDDHEPEEVGHEPYRRGPLDGRRIEIEAERASQAHEPEPADGGG